MNSAMQKDTFFSDLNSEQSHALFQDFIETWNDGLLSHVRCTCI